MGKLYSRIALVISIFITVILFQPLSLTATDPCVPAFNFEGAPLLMEDGISQVCKSDLSPKYTSETCEQAFNPDETPMLEYATGNSSYNPASLFYCPDPEDPPETSLQFFEDIDKNPLNLPVASLPYNIPIPGYQPPGGGLCGNGFLDPGEECDFGPNESEQIAAYDINLGTLREDADGQPIIIVGNDDSIPNWCRTDCSLPYFGDGIVDSSFAEEEDVNGNEVSVATSAAWLAFADTFRNNPEVLYGEDSLDPQFVEANPGSGDSEIENPNNEALVCDRSDHTCKVLSEAAIPGGSCTKDSDCGHFACVPNQLVCERVEGPGTTECSEATVDKDCGYLTCDPNSPACIVAPGPGMADQCNSNLDCWGSRCSLRAAQCVKVPVGQNQSNCTKNSDCSGGTIGGNTTAHNLIKVKPKVESADLIPAPSPAPCSPGSNCNPGQCPNWCEENLNECSGDMEDWCTHDDNKCNLECIELFGTFEHRYKNYNVNLEYSADIITIGEHIGGGITFPYWVAVNRFDRKIVCDSENRYGSTGLLTSFHNHGRTIRENLVGTRIDKDWIFEGPTCVENLAAGGYKLHHWDVKALDGSIGAVPSCILEGNIGPDDCNLAWEDKHTTAITSRACIEALLNSDFFCDKMCANDGYVLPYNEISEDLEDSFFADILYPPKITDLGGKNLEKGEKLRLYMARSGVFTNWKNANDWQSKKTKLIETWDLYHNNKEWSAFTCRGAYGENPEDHWGIHLRIDSWPIKTLSGLQGHNSNTDARAQLRLSKHCSEITGPEDVVTTTTSEVDWKYIHGIYAIEDICLDVCGGSDARLDPRNLARKWSPAKGRGASVNSSSIVSKSSLGANHWDLNNLGPFTSFASDNPVCSNLSSNEPFCDAKAHTRKAGGQKMVEGM